MSLEASEASPYDLFLKAAVFRGNGGEGLLDPGG